MPHDQACPSQDRLSDFVLGRTTEAEARSIETHLAICPHCVAALEQVPGDPLLAAVRQSKDTIEVAERDGTPEVVQLPFPMLDGLQATDASLGVHTETCLPLQHVESRDDTAEVYSFMSRSTALGECGRLGPYNVLEQLGRGGMGVVFRAEDVQLQRSVALKVLRPHAAAAPGAVQRFLAEARAAASFKHDHVVTIYQVGEEDGVPYLAMELLEGESLEEALTRESRMSPGDVCRVGIETASALAAAHAQRMVHRDIKPANLWLEKPSRRVKVLDFGLARAFTSELNLTGQGTIVGTPAYMAPEQARGETVDGRTDLFSLGVVLYRCLTGTNPFRGRDAISTLVAVTAESPVPPSEIRPEVPQRLSDFVMHLLAKNPVDRPESAEQVVGELTAIRHELAAVPAALTGPKPQMQEPPRGCRNRVVTGLLGFFAFLAAVVVIVRDRDGKPVATIKVPEGKTVVIEVEEDSNGELKTPSAGSPTAPQPPFAPLATTSPSVPTAASLEEWLKGRTVLTVAQDGTGQFGTIQAALDVLRPGQAVQVLGGGPYCEQLKVTELPRDTGLFSTSEAIIECAGWQESYKEPPDATGRENQVYSGHIFNHPRGFRLHGLEWRFAPSGTKTIQPLTIFNAENMIVENCVFRATQTDDVQWINITNQSFPNPPAADIVVRDCVFESQLWLNSRGENSRFLVERNFFVGPGKLGSFVIADSRLSTAVVRHNVFVGQQDVPMLTIARLLACDNLRIVNNTFDSPIAMQFVGQCPSQGTAAIRNNLLTGSRGLMIITSDVKASAAAYLEKHSIGHNAFSGPLTEPEDLRGLVSTEGDFRQTVPLLSADPVQTTYLRIPADFATTQLGGAGGEFADYRGALPPGPPPPEGDWFTSLRQRLRNSRSWINQPSLKQLAEPPPLDEWLKGRTVLTVSQDGAGKFRTIQAALDALQPDQVVVVLDKGPYRESLTLNNPPDNVGLVSTNQTILEVQDWRQYRNENSSYDWQVGQLFLSPNGFRLSGFDLIGTVDPGARTLALLDVEGGARLTIEDCQFRLHNSDGSLSSNLSAIRLNGLGRDEHSPHVLRDCVLNGGVVINGWPGMVAPPLFVLRNYLEAGSPGYGLLFGGQLRRTHVRHNVVKSSEKSVPFIYELDSSAVPPELIEFAHNTVVGSGNSRFLTSAPREGVVIRNNILPVFQLRRGAEKQTEFMRNWEISGNLFPVRPESFPSDPKFANVYRRPDDPTVDVTFLSESPEDSEFGRVAAVDGVGTAGALPIGGVPNRGDWFTRLRERWGVLKRRDLETPAFLSKPGTAKSSSELSPLEEWLKGRTILTVSQDGTGNFSTIQAALDHVASGQAIEVLDRGPYRERLSVQLPPDCGLFTRVQTVLNFDDWQFGWPGDFTVNGEPSKVYLGFDFVSADRFRLSGFDFQFPPPKGTYESGHMHQRLTVRLPKDCMVENCRFARSGSGCADGEPIVLSCWDDPESSEMFVVVRDCVIDGSVAVNTNSKNRFSPDDRKSVVVFERTVFLAEEIDHHLLVAGQNLQQLEVRECLFAGAVRHNIALSHVSELATIKVCNCSFNGTYGIYFVNAVPDTRATIRNNLRTGEGIVHFGVPAGKFRERVQREWSVDHNAYWAVKLPNTHPVSLRPAATDVIVNPRFLATAMSSPNAFRLAPDDKLGSAGAGGSDTIYIGPLPPGPPPPEGDWWTRLRERWLAGNTKDVPQ